MGKSAHTTYRAIRLLLALSLAFPSVIRAQSAAATAEAERLRRRAGVEEAEMLLQKGDEAYQKGNFADAAEAYSGAREQLPDAPLSRELRQAATDRYAQASVEHARELVRKGDRTGASTLVDRILEKNAAPHDPGALALRAHLDDPIRTNPTVDAEHARKVDEVRRLLYTAEGAYELGKFDEADKHYESILRIDPTNTAARRGMQRVNQAIQSSARSAQDQTRAEMLTEVDKQWETRLPPTLEEAPTGFGREASPVAPDSDIRLLLNQIRLGQVSLTQATLAEAVDYLRTVSRLPGPDGQVINYTMNLGPAEDPRSARIRGLKFDLQLTDVPLRHVLDVITDMTKTTYTTDGFAVVIRPAGSDTNEVQERTFRVTPDFLTSLASRAGGNAAAGNDPFAANTDAGPGLVTARMSAQDAFSRQGVEFPTGTYARFIPGNNTLIVRNTAANLDMIQQVIDSIAQTEPVMVAVRVTMISTQKENLEELGFDWLLTPTALGDNVFASGGTAGSGSPRTGADFTNPVNGTTLSGLPLDPTAQASNVITNGLRSGQYSTTGNTLDNLIANPSRESQATSVAPGILSLTGLYTDGQVQTIMRGLSQKKNVDIMARPSTVTRSGQQSIVQMISEFPYATEYAEPQIPTGIGAGGGAAPATPANPESFEFRTVGVELEVLPVADAEKRYVDVTLAPSFSKFDGFVNYGSPINSTTTDILGNPVTQEITENAILMPIFSTQRTNTQLTIADGATVVFAGLMSDQIQQVEDQVPILGQLPMIGRLFNTKSNQPMSTAIIFLVQVELIDPTGRPYRDR